MNIIAPITASLRYEIVSETVTLAAEGGAPLQVVSVSAPEGMKVVGGGHSGAATRGGQLQVVESHPSEDGSAWSLTMQFNFEWVSPTDITVWAVCLSAA